jgi:AhpD family alkylhydroperoxidase
MRKSPTTLGRAPAAGCARYGEGLWLAFDCGNGDQSPRYKNKGTDGAAVSIAVRCEGCVAYHTKMAHQHGASREEVAETVALAVYMGGGPAAVYGGDALRAYNQFSGT